MKALLKLLGLDKPAPITEATAEAAAKKAFAALYPEEQAINTMVRAREDHRLVIAVLYGRPGIPPSAGLGPYKLFAVHKDDLAVEELSPEAGAPYQIRGVR
ncbi:MAG: hypothetical protein K1X64_15885 [Myxococcaceae bacterium]|nr:hypothetical protein [Myxococcaceae bacterium]